MTTTDTVENPEAAWELALDFLRNLFFMIGYHGDVQIGESERIQAMGEVRAQLIGRLYELALRMGERGYANDASHLREVLDMVVRQDLADERKRAAIYLRGKELMERSIFPKKPSE